MTIHAAPELRSSRRWALWTTDEPSLGSIRGVRKAEVSPNPEELKKLTLHGVGHGFQAIVGLELLVDVVQMVAQCLLSDPEMACYVPRVFAGREQSQDHSFMLRKGRHGFRSHHDIWYSCELARDFHHFTE